MTASLAANPSIPLPSSMAQPIAAVARDFVPRTRSPQPWSPATAASQVSPIVGASEFPQAPRARVRLLDSIDAYARQLEKRLGNLPDTVTAYDDRISVLEEQASVEGYFLNSRSREIFLDFFKNNPLIQLGHLFLLENGNLRAVWKGADASHVGLQFLDNGLIQYVLSKQRHADLPVSRAYGRDTPSGVIGQISALQLDQVLYR